MRALEVALFLLASAAPVQAAPSFVEVRGCRPAAEEGEFLQSCVKLNVGKRAGRLLGPGLVAPGGEAAAVLRHRRYGSAGDRITLRLYGQGGKLEGSYPMGSGGDEYPLSFSSPPARYLAWVEVDGRGGQLRVVDRVRRRMVLSALTPLEEWPIFAPSGSKLLLPRGEPGDEQARELVIVDLAVRGSRQVVLRADEGEELVQPRWSSSTAVQAVRRKAGAARGKTVHGRFQSPPASRAAPGGASSDAE